MLRRHRGGRALLFAASIRQCRFDSLKLAPWLVADLPGNQPKAAIAEAIIGLARRRSLRAFALGLTNAEPVRLLESLGCGQIQGEWIRMSDPADRCASLTRSRQASQMYSHRSPAT